MTEKIIKKQQAKEQKKQEKQAKEQKKQKKREDEEKIKQGVAEFLAQEQKDKNINELEGKRGQKLRELEGKGDQQQQNLKSDGAHKGSSAKKNLLQVELTKEELALAKKLEQYEHFLMPKELDSLDVKPDPNAPYYHRNQHDTVDDVREKKREKNENIFRNKVKSIYNLTRDQGKEETILAFPEVCRSLCQEFEMKKVILKQLEDRKIHVSNIGLFSVSSMSKIEESAHNKSYIKNFISAIHAECIDSYSLFAKDNKKCPVDIATISNIIGKISLEDKADVFTFLAQEIKTFHQVLDQDYNYQMQP